MKSIFLRTSLLMLICISNVYALTRNDFTNKDWILKSLNGIPIGLEIYTGKKPRIKFDNESRYAAWAGCNNISGDYVFTEPNLLRVEDAAMTKMACPGPQNIESEFINALKTVQTVNLTLDRLQLLDASQHIVLEFLYLPGSST